MIYIGSGPQYTTCILTAGELEVADVLVEGVQGEVHALADHGQVAPGGVRRKTLEQRKHWKLAAGEELNYRFFGVPKTCEYIEEVRPKLKVCISLAFFEMFPLT